MDTRDMFIDVGLAIAISIIITVSLFGCYKSGRYYERKDLTQYFAQMTSDTYYEAYDDGFKLGFTAGVKSVKCPENVEEDGRY